MLNKGDTFIVKEKCNRRKWLERVVEEIDRVQFASKKWRRGKKGQK